MVLELMIGGLNREGAEAKVTAYDEVRRAMVLREAADWFDRFDTDSAFQLRRMADTARP